MSQRTSIQSGGRSVARNRRRQHLVSGRRAQGFSLIESVVVVAVLAILAGIALPSFAALIRENRVVAVTNDLLGAIHLARSEAIKQGRRITICTSADLDDCESDIGWHRGWIMFEDRDEDGVRGDGERILSVGQAQNGAVSITGNEPVRNYVSYVPSGATRKLNGALLMGTITLCSDGVARQIVINASGRPRSARSGGCDPAVQS